jgi:hypothetical protein
VLKDLGAFYPPVFDKLHHVLVEALYGFSHFRVEALCAHEAGDKVVECLVDFAVSGYHG